MKDEITVIEHIHCKEWFSWEIEIFEGMRVYGHFSVGSCVSQGGI